MSALAVRALKGSCDLFPVIIAFVSAAKFAQGVSLVIGRFLEVNYHFELTHSILH